MPKHRKIFYPKVSHGLREQRVPEVGSPEDVLGSSLSLMGTGAQVGSAFGPAGTAIGAGVGLLGGAALGLATKQKKDKAHKEAEEKNKYITEQNQLYGGHYQYESPEEQLYKHGGIYHSDKLRGNQKVNVSFIPSPAKFKTSKKTLLKESKKNLIDKVRDLEGQTIEGKTPRYQENTMSLPDKALHGHRKELAYAHDYPIDEYDKITKYYPQAQYGARADLSQYEGLVPGNHKSVPDSSLEIGKGSSPIEIEKRELAFRSVKDKQDNTTNRVRLVEDFKKAPTHDEGGELYQAKHGDFIIPEYQRDEAFAAYDKGDYETLQSMRLKLPKSGEMREGEYLDYTEPYRETSIETAEKGINIGIGQERGGFFEEATEDAKLSRGIPYENDPIFLSDFTNKEEKIEKEKEKEEKRERLNKGLTTAIELAPSLYDIGVGLFEKPTTYQPQTFPRSEQAIDEFRNFNLDVSPQIEQVERDKRAAHERARMTGLPQANFYQIEAQANRAKNKVLSQKINTESQVRLEAPKLAYQLGITEGQATQQAMLMTQQADAMKRDYLEKGLEGLSKYTIGTVSNRQLLELLVSKGYLTEKEAGDLRK